MNPERTVPRATYAAVGFLGLFCAFAVWIAVQAFGDDRVVAAAGKDPAGLFFTAITTYVGGWAADLRGRPRGRAISIGDGIACRSPVG